LDTNHVLDGEARGFNIQESNWLRITYSNTTRQQRTLSTENWGGVCAICRGKGGREGKRKERKEKEKRKGEEKR
jgi:hypothetical protein